MRTKFSFSNIFYILLILVVSSQSYTIASINVTTNSNAQTNITTTYDVITNSTNNNNTHLVEIKCTSNCICDHYRGLRRASCDNKRMIYIKDNIPRKTEVLIFTHNYITNIRNEEFQDNELEDLKVLNLSTNRIGDIEIFAFENMNKLKILDLSRNALEYVLPEWFWNLKSLEELYLDYNNLRTFKDASLFESVSLEILGLSNSQISYLSSETFAKMPNLQVLDVSNNHLIDFKPVIVKPLVNLLRINYENNLAKCEDLLDLRKYLDDLSIEQNNDCQQEISDSDVEEFDDSNKNLKRKHQFEKMMDGTTSSEEDENEIETSWVFEETIKDDGVKLQECTPLKRGFLWEIIELSPIATLIVTITFGFLLGLIIGCSCKCGKKPKVKLRKNVKSIRSVSRSYSIIRSGPSFDRQYLIDQDI